MLLVALFVDWADANICCCIKGLAEKMAPADNTTATTIPAATKSDCFIMELKEAMI